jgi:hypothetical protein
MEAQASWESGNHSHMVNAITRPQMRLAISKPRHAIAFSRRWLVDPLDRSAKLIALPTASGSFATFPSPAFQA